MTPVHYPEWQVTVQLPPSESLEYKFVKINGSGDVVWESNAIRTLRTGTGGALETTARWGIK